MAEPPPKKVKKQESADTSLDLPPMEVEDKKVEDLVNDQYLSDEFIEAIRTDYKSQKPFSYTVLPNFLDENFLEHVEKELLNEEFFIMNNDLYTFLQSNDLKVSSKKYMSKLREVIYSPKFRNFLTKITGIQLIDKVDISSSKYWNGGQLLCHDDELEGRRIAFIFYLVPKDWSEEDGGTLDLFQCNAAGQPETVTESILPVWNNFLFFEVTPTSFHQVAEVLSQKQRLSVSGWFHGEPIVRPPPYVEQPLPKSAITSNTSVDLKAWINPLYLNPKYHEQINAQMTAQSSIELGDFLIQDKWEALSLLFEKTLQAEVDKQSENKASSSSGDSSKNEETLPFSLIGPANRRHYESLGRWKQAALPKSAAILEEAIQLFKSPEFGELLKSITGLEVVSVHNEVRQFRQGAYTLAQDNQDQHSERGLDGYYFLCPVDTWDVDVGGQITYMDEEDELVTIIPSDNSLCLVFRDSGCMKYVKYVNNEAPSARQEITLIYWEKAE